jgi:YidC/Oxa1 family membrane protein insertase
VRFLAALPWSPLFQGLLDGIGAVLAWLYGLVGNYGVAIIILTVVIRVILLPLGVKQIKSMQAMQAIQPKVKEIQKKYKNNKQKAQEETMKLYRESGVNPLGGCLPLLLQFPILISMYAVIRPPSVVPEPTTGPVQSYEIENNHLPVDSELFRNVVSHRGTDFLLMNLQCSAAQAGNDVPLKDTTGDQIGPEKPLEVGEVPVGTSRSTLDCGDGIPVKIPYFVMLAFMIGTTFYQQRQMTKASPVGAQSSQQQAILKIMPVMFGIFGFTFPAGLVVYWTTSNLWQIGQQAALLRAGHIGPDALERRREEMANKPPRKGGMFSGVMARAEDERKRRGGGTTGAKGAKGAAGASGTGRGRQGDGGSRAGGSTRGGRSTGSGAKGGSSGRNSGGKRGSAGNPRGGSSGSSGGSTSAKGDEGGTASGGRGSAGRGSPPQRPKPKRPGGGSAGDS